MLLVLRLSLAGAAVIGIGWFVISLVLTIVAVNTLFIIYFCLRHICLICEKQRKIKKKQQKVLIEQQVVYTNTKQDDDDDVKFDDALKLVNKREGPYDSMHPGYG